jgi:hypothetical protein
MKMCAVTSLSVIVGLVVGFVLLDLVAILISGHAVEAGVGRILIRLAFVRGVIALIVAILRRGSR